MKKIIVVLLSLLVGLSAYADTCSKTLQPLFTADQARYLCARGFDRYLTATSFETVAAGTSAQGDGPLTASKTFHYITGFNETKVVTLPACATANIGEIHWVINPTQAAYAKIFPALGAAINGLAANAVYNSATATQATVQAGSRTIICYCQAANQWYCS